jgi:hypothetical protein
MSGCDVSHLRFDLKCGRKLLGTIEWPVIASHSKSVVVESPGGRLRLHRQWHKRYSVIYAEKLQRWLDALATGSRTQQLIPLRHAVVLPDRVRGVVDVLLRAPLTSSDGHQSEAEHYPGVATIWVPGYVTSQIDESRIGVEFWMINEVLEATSRHRLDLDPESSIPLSRGFCPEPTNSWKGIPDVEAAVRRSFYELGVPNMIPPWEEDF